MDLIWKHAFFLVIIVLLGGQVHAQDEEEAVEGSLGAGNI